MEKNSTKMSLSTAICFIIIFLLVVALIFVYLQNDKRTKDLEDKIALLEEQQNNTADTNTIVNNNTMNNNEVVIDNKENEIKIVGRVGDGDETLYPAIYIDENGYVYYNSEFSYGSTKIEYRRICDKDGNAIKPNMIILQTPSTRNQIDPKITDMYTFLTDNGIYEFNYYYDDVEGKEIFSKYAEIKYNEVMNDYKFLEAKDQYGGHTINMLLSNENNEQKLIDINIAFDVKTKTNLIADSWHMDLEQDN